MSSSQESVNKGLEWYDKGEAFFETGNYEKALDCFTRSAELVQQNHVPRQAIAAAYHAMEKYEEAIKHYDIAIGLNPNVANVWAEKGKALMGLKKDDDALKCFDRARRIDPENQEAHKGWEFIWQERGFCTKLRPQGSLISEIKNWLGF